MCSLLLLLVEGTHKYRRVGLSARLFDCRYDQFAEERDLIMGRVVEKEFETIVIV